MFKRHQKILVMLVLAVIFSLGVIALCCWLLGPVKLTLALVPAPQPYPGAALIPKIIPGIFDPICQGDEDFSASYEYTVNHPLVEVQSYYEKELRLFCKQSGSFSSFHCSDGSVCEATMSCSLASTAFPFPYSEHSFQVFLSSKDEAHTYIYHIRYVLDGNNTNAVCGSP